MRQWWAAMTALVLLAGGLVLSPVRAAGNNGPTGNVAFVGVATCAGSVCHGRSEGNGAVVRQDELLHWQDPASKGGAHSRAYAALTGKRGQQIAATLGLGSAAAAPACLGCHATDAPAALRGPVFHLNDGVGCESCHGAAGAWLPSHYTMFGTHQANVALGMTPLENPQVRAGVCLDCHLGSTKPGHFVTHRMMAAGHPRIAFELDLFSTLQQHHDEDADYQARKGKSDSVRLWAVGQAEAVRRSLSLFAVPALASDGIFPQFTFYDCHSCHRRIYDQAERSLTFEANPARPIPFGMPPYNDENIILLSAVAHVLTPGQAAQFDVAARNFHAAMGSGRPAAQAAAGKLAAAAGALSGALAKVGGGSDTAFTVVATIAGKATSPRFTDYAGSAQAVMAVDTLLNALVKQGRVTVGAAAGIRGHIERAYAAVSSPNAYDPPAFRAALGEAARAIGALR